ncbi:L-fucose-proton symporter [compost metagenome]
MPYLVLGVLILLIAALFFFTKLPDIKDDEEDGKAGFFHALRHKNVRWAVIAQFFYVGAQVCILSFLVLYATEVAGISGKDGADYAGFAGLAFMLGRFIGTFFMRFVSASKLLIIYSFVTIALSLFVIFGTGVQTLYALIGIAFFMSIMFPTIFAFGVQGIGADTKSASSLIVMSIVGGALLPPLLGLISDTTGHFQYGYFVPLVCFIVVLAFAFQNRNVSIAETENLKSH